MFDRLRAAAREMESALAEIEPMGLVGSAPATGIELLTVHERKVAAVRARLTARASDMNHWQRQGYRSFEDWLAATVGTSAGQARRKAQAARTMADQDEVAEALGNGEISEEEADVVADAAQADPDARRELLDTARNKHKSNKDLKDRAARAKAAAEDDRERAERLRRGRSTNWGRDRDGFWTLSGKFQPDVGAELKARLEAEVDRRFTQARRQGRREPLACYRADALAALILGPPPGAAVSDARSGEDGTPAAGGEKRAAADDGAAVVPRAGKELVLDINLETLRRGCVEPGETCQIRGVGPVPVEIARTWVDDAFVKAVIRDGIDVQRVAHFGRHIPAHLRTALGLLDTTCAVPGCSDPRMEYDHRQRHADGGVCSTANLRPLCVRHHRQRTHDGYELIGEPGDRRWLGPDGRVLFADNPDPTDQPARAP
jgi:hypothetical protein